MFWSHDGLSRDVFPKTNELMNTTATILASRTRARRLTADRRLAVDAAIGIASQAMIVRTSHHHVCCIRRLGVGADPRQQRLEVVTDARLHLRGYHDDQRAPDGANKCSRTYKSRPVGHDRLRSGCKQRGDQATQTCRGTASDGTAVVDSTEHFSPFATRSPPGTSNAID